MRILHVMCVLCQGYAIVCFLLISTAQHMVMYQTNTLVSTLLYLILMTNIDFYAHHCQHSLEDAIPSSPILNSLS